MHGGSIRVGPVAEHIEWAGALILILAIYLNWLHAHKIEGDHKS